MTTTAAPGKPFAGGNVTVEVAPGKFGAGRSPTFVPVMMNFGSAVAGACGTVIFWKHVGHSITEPACDESHLMCWPHTGQAYLNSLMAVGQTFHIRAGSGNEVFTSQFYPAPPPCRADKMPLPPRVFALKTVRRMKKKSPVSRSGRFAGGPAADVAQFTESISFDWRLWRHDILGSMAHADMLHTHRRADEK